ncbi:MAG: ATP-binding cassette domain-containing protein [Myxococcales bacterium]|nr:ATP-binding cassette domain-containing protein [Myxococcales bacterium]
MIEALNLTKRYGAVKALDDVSFEVKRGEVLGFLGPNGAGKTTTMKILTCFIAPTEGTARVNGIDVFEDSIGVRQAIGYLPESTPLYTEMMVSEYLDFVARMRGFRGGDISKRIEAVVDQAALGSVFQQEIRALSKGYRQRVGIAQALIHEPPLLILDEPLSGLDPNQAAEMRQLITHLGKERTVILSTHNLAEVQTTCSRVLIIASGRLVADDTPDELRERAGKPAFEASFLAEGEAGKKARDTLGALPGVAEVKKLDQTSGEVRFLVTGRGSDDLRAAIFRAAVAADLVLVGLERRGENLEDVFRDLTTGDAPKVEAKVAKKKAADKKKTAGDKKAADDKKAASDEQAKKAADAEAKNSSATDTDDEEPGGADQGDDESAA